MSSLNQTSRTENFPAFIQQTLLPFATQFPLQYVQGKNHCQLAYRHFLHPEKAEKFMVLVNGRAENLTKWTELAWDFYQQGFDVLLFDHRGQGHSQRLLKNPQKGYLDEFRFYADDLDLVVKQANSVRQYAQQFLIAHSMGALISAYYLANYDHDIQKAVFSAPFFGVPTAHPTRDAFCVNLMLLLGQGDRYVFGQGDFAFKKFAQNKLTHSEERLNWQNKTVELFPQTALGGATFRWLHLCWQAIFALPTILTRIEIPILVLEAQEEQIVNNENLAHLVSFLAQGKLEKISKAYHEILFEKDEVRTQALSKITQFFSSK